MNDKIYTEFQEVFVNNLTNYVQQGWEIIQVYQVNDPYNYQGTLHITGTFMGNTVSLDIPSPTTKVLIGRTNNARVLFEKKNEV